MDISVIVCTYNPEERTFRRCLNAIKNLQVEGVQTEVVLIDNNSTVPIASLDYVAEFIRVISHSKIVVEKKQGLTYARIAGFRQSSGNLIIFFDDDNEPFPDFLIQAKCILADRPFVGVMGPGYINVEYLDKVEPWIQNHLNKYFQEKNATSEEYILSVMEWFPCYPPGTGQIIRRSVFDSYQQFFSTKRLKTLDRKGNDLSSAGDSQIIWSSMNLNMAVGHHPDIRINHLIASKRANLDYIKRLRYYLDLSGTLAFFEMYPEKKTSVQHYQTSSFLFGLFKIFFHGVKNKEFKNIKLNIAALAGRNQAYITISDRKMPFALRVIKKMCKIV